MSGFGGRRGDEEDGANLRALNSIEAFELLNLPTDNLVVLSTGEIIFDTNGQLITSP
jgi:hypothetical protein